MVEWDRGFTSSSPEYQQMVLDSDFEEFRSEKIIQNNKSPEEIEKLSVDESLSPLDRAVLLLSTGQEVQKLCVIEQLPSLLKLNQMDTLYRVIPKVCTLLPGASEEFQELASKAFTEIVEQDLVPVQIFISSCLPSVLKQVESKDCVSSNLWLECALFTIPHLPKDVIKRQILRVAEANGQLSMTVTSRQGACRLLGAMAPKFDSYWVKKEVCPLAKSLCLDVDSEVRMVMCQQLNHIIRALGLELGKSTLYPQLIELCHDEEPGVKAVAIEALLDLATFLDQDTLGTGVEPEVRRFCEWGLASRDSEPVLAVAGLIGRICYELRDVFTGEQRLWFMSCYCKLVSHQFPEKRAQGTLQACSAFTLTVSDVTDKDEVECRRLCAFNIPAMVLFSDGSFDKELFSSLKLLTDSPHTPVRRTLASGLHEVVKLLSNGSRMKIAPIYQNLLKDTSPEVLYALVANLSQSLESFAQASNLSPHTKQPGLLDFISPLMNCELTASSCRQWRLLQQLLSALSCLVQCMTSDQLSGKFVPLLLKYITSSCVLPVKLAASKTLCMFIRHIRKQELRQDLCTRLSEDCAQNPSYKQRLLYIDICGYILDIFSRSFFKEHFFHQLLELANDPIVNVRLHLCQLLPALKSVLKLPGDRVLLQKLEQTVRKLISHERDPDASQAIRSAVIEMDRIEVAMETLTRRTFFEADLTDQRREEEEKALLLSEAKELEKQPKKPTAGGKAGKSPNENRKGSSSSLVGLVGGSSPSSGAKCSTGKSRGSNPVRPAVQKCLSAPNPSFPTTEPPGHTGLLSARKAPSASPQNSPSMAHKSRASSMAKASQTSMASASSKVSVNKSKDSVGKSQPRKKVNQYGLEYSKPKKRT